MIKRFFVFIKLLFERNCLEFKVKSIFIRLLNYGDNNNPFDE